VGTTGTRVPALSGPRAISRGCPELSPRKLARTGSHRSDLHLLFEDHPREPPNAHGNGNKVATRPTIVTGTTCSRPSATSRQTRASACSSWSSIREPRSSSRGERASGIERTSTSWRGGASGRGRDRRGDSRPGSAGLALRRLLTLQFGRASRQSARAAGTPRARAGRASGSGGIPSPAQCRARWPPDRRPSATAVRHFPILGKPRAATRGTRRRPRRGRSDCGG
jgi:hypothetical protein